MKSTKIDYIIFFLIVISIYSGINTYSPEFLEFFATEKTIIDTISIKSFFCQIDDCESQIIELLDSANEINCAFFDINLKNLLNKLEEKNTKIIIDDTNKNELENYNIDYITDSSQKLMHNKFCIIDNNIIITGSMNPTQNGNSKNDNNIVIIESKILAKNYIDEFDEMYYSKEFHDPNSKKVTTKTIIDPEKNIKIINLFCPEDNCEIEVENILKQAKNEILFMTFSFTSDVLGNSISSIQNITVKGIFEKTQNINSQYSEYQKMNEKYGKNIRLDTNPNNMHHKVFIVDKSIVITGSYNPTNNGNKNNDENILIIYDRKIAADFNEEFERIWELT